MSIPTTPALSPLPSPHRPLLGDEQDWSVCVNLSPSNNERTESLDCHRAPVREASIADKLIRALLAFAFGAFIGVLTLFASIAIQWILTYHFDTEDDKESNGYRQHKESHSAMTDLRVHSCFRIWVGAVTAVLTLGLWVTHRLFDEDDNDDEVDTDDNGKDHVGDGPQSVWKVEFLSVERCLASGIVVGIYGAFAVTNTLLRIKPAATEMAIVSGFLFFVGSIFIIGVTVEIYRVLWTGTNGPLLHRNKDRTDSTSNHDDDDDDDDDDAGGAAVVHDPESVAHRRSGHGCRGHQIDEQIVSDNTSIV